jgi:gliding motility-associated-like protein
VFEITLDEPVELQSLAAPVNEIGVLDPSGAALALKKVTVSNSPPAIRIELMQPVSFAGALSVVALAGPDNNTFSDACGNFVPAGTAWLQVPVFDDMQVDLGPDVLQCPADNRPLLQAPAGTGWTYGWTLNGQPYGAPANTLQTTAPGIYNVSVTAGPGCAASDSMTLALLPAPAVALGADTAVCNGGALPALDAGAGALAYAWTLNGQPLPQNGPVLQTAAAGVYAVTVTGMSCSAADTVRVAHFPPIEPGLVQQSFLVCKGEIIEPLSPSPGLSYVWHYDRDLLYDDAQATDPASPAKLKAGWNYVTVTDTNGCSVTDSIRVTFIVKPGMPEVHCPSLTNGVPAYTWTAVPGAEWYEVSADGGLNWIFPSNGKGAMRHESAGPIMVRAMSEGQCDAGEPAGPGPCGLQVPSAISPNGDGSNDFLRIANNGGFTVIRLSIFNRYGQRVFFDPGYRDTWDARGMPGGTYFYIVEAGGGNSLRGFITVAK